MPSIRALNASRLPARRIDSSVGHGLSSVAGMTIVGHAKIGLK